MSKVAMTLRMRIISGVRCAGVTGTNTKRSAHVAHEAERSLKLKDNTGNL